MINVSYPNPVEVNDKLWFGGTTATTDEALYAIDDQGDVIKADFALGSIPGWNGFVTALNDTFYFELAGYVSDGSHWAYKDPLVAYEKGSGDLQFFGAAGTE